MFNYHKYNSIKRTERENKRNCKLKNVVNDNTKQHENWLLEQLYVNSLPTYLLSEVKY